jgi:ribosomal protein S18
MPTIQTIGSIRIDIYSREHRPPHFHAKYAEHEEFIEIDTLITYAGKLPKIQRKRITDWAANNKEFLLKVFKQLNPGL